MKYKYLILSCLMIFSGAIFAQNDTIVQEVTADTIVVQDLAKNAEYFSKGIEAKYNENYPLAIVNFEQALKFFNDDDASMYELASLYQQDERNIEALSMIKRAADLKPDNKWYQIKLAEIYLRNYDYQSFINIYDKLLENEPENLDYLETYIDVLLRIGEFDKVIEKLDVLEDMFGESEAVYLQKIELYKEQGKKEKVLEELEKLVELMPENTRYLSMLAEMYRQNKRDKEAYKIYLKIKELEPENQYIDISLMEYYKDMGEIDKSFDALILALKNKNLDFTTKLQIYDFWFGQFDDENTNREKIKIAGNAIMETHPDKFAGYFIIGGYYYYDKDYVKAKEYYMQALERDGNNFAVLYQLVLCNSELNDGQSIMELSEKGIELYPQNPAFYFFNGLAHFVNKNYEQAVKIFEKGRFFTTDKAVAVNFDIYIGDSYHFLNNKEKAYAAYERVIKVEPDNIYVLNNYAYYLSLDNQQLEKALQMSEKTIKAEPKNPTYLDTYAWILYKMERYREAKKYMDKAFKYEKNPSGVNFEHLGDILYKMGDTKNAVKNWEKAKKHGDASEFIEQKIKDEKLYE